MQVKTSGKLIVEQHLPLAIEVPGLVLAGLVGAGVLAGVLGEDTGEAPDPDSASSVPVGVGGRGKGVDPGTSGASEARLLGVTGISAAGTLTAGLFADCGGEFVAGERVRAGAPAAGLPGGVVNAGVGIVVVVGGLPDCVAALGLVVVTPDLGIGKGLQLVSLWCLLMGRHLVRERRLMTQERLPWCQLRVGSRSRPREIFETRHIVTYKAALTTCTSGLSSTVMIDTLTVTTCPRRREEIELNVFGCLQRIFGASVA